MSQVEQDLKALLPTLFVSGSGIVLYRNGIFTIGKFTPSMFRSQTTLTVNFSRYRTWWEALLVELLVSVRSNLGRKRAKERATWITI
jgi:hypothetical protein